ncbi:MAG: HupE/UreJ family protein [Rhodobiaceae bacterium]|nr:HupE/UreJ family protein [Rhodobiaceae bacterium]
MLRLFSAAAVLAVLSTPAFAHLSPGTHGSVAAGLTHPLTGLDHILAMVAVGLWAFMLGGRAAWAMPLAFVTAMLAGYGLALAGVGLPFVEPMVLASIVVLGVAVAMALRPSTSLSIGIAALFALFHGHAHGGEVGDAAVLRFAIGFAISTALLHVAGLGLGLLTTRVPRMTGVARVLGGLAALAGVALSFA